MRILWLLGALTLLSACSSYSVRCTTHLRPINVPERSASAAQPRVPGTSATAPGGGAAGKP
jgi:hypothetical protein